jgi:effector-binding domain-containing protein
MIDTPTILKTEAQTVAVIHITVPREAIREVMGPGRKELMDTLAAQGITPAGPWFSHHLRMDPRTFDFEIGVPVSAKVTPAGRVKPSELPAATVARTIFHGSYEGLGNAWGEFTRWITAAGKTAAPSLWETYLTDPGANPDPSTWRTELTRPLIDL